MTPTALWRRARARVAQAGDDRGAALIYAMIFITVVAVVIAAVISLASANLRATVAVRSQATETAGADGAAQAAINQLRRDLYTGATTCLGASNQLALPNFYQPASGPADSAVVTCDPDTETSIGVINQTRPAAALMTLGSTETADIKINGAGTVRFGGDVYAMGKLNVDQKDTELQVLGNVRAVGDCTGKAIVTELSPGTMPVVCKTAMANPDPNYANPPAAPATPTTPPACSARMEFQPGLYNNRDALQTAFNCPEPVLFDFRPGIYYFSWLNGGPATNNIVEISKGTLIGGALAPVTSTPTVGVNDPRSCRSPLTDPASAFDGGVQFVFGNGARMNVTDRAQVELCGRKSLTTPPIAIYGLDENITGVPKLTGCAATAGGCAVFSTDNRSDNVSLYVHGVVYTPSAKIELDVRKVTGQFFKGGIIARTVTISAPGSATTPDPMIGLPVPNYTYASRVVVVLSVYLCPGQSSCTTATGTLRLKVKVGFSDPTGFPTAGQRQVTVYSWAVQR